MKIEVSTDNSIEGSESLTVAIKDIVRHGMAHLEDHITRIEVHLSEAKIGNDGHEGKHCMLEARLKGRQPTVVNHDAETVEKAIKGAADKLKSVLESTLGKLSDQR